MATYQDQLRNLYDELESDEPFLIGAADRLDELEADKAELLEALENHGTELNRILNGYISPPRTRRAFDFGRALLAKHRGQS